MHRVSWGISDGETGDPHLIQQYTPPCTRPALLALTAQLRSGPKSTTSDQRSRHPHDSPRRGESSVSHTKTLISGRAQNQLHPPHIGGGLGGGGCFFASFFAPKKVREMGPGGIPQQGAPCILLVAMLYKSEQSSSDSRPSLGALNLCARENE